MSEIRIPMDQAFGIDVTSENGFTVFGDEILVKGRVFDALASVEHSIQSNPVIQPNGAIYNIPADALSIDYAHNGIRMKIEISERHSPSGTTLTPSLSCLNPRSGEVLAQTEFLPENTFDLLNDAIREAGVDAKLTLDGETVEEAGSPKSVAAVCQTLIDRSPEGRS